MSVAKPILDYVRSIRTQAEILRSRSMFRRLLNYHKPYLLIFVLIAVLAVLGAYLFTLEPIYTAQIIDIVITQGEYGVLSDLILRIVLVVMAFGAINFVVTYVQGHAAQLIIRDLRADYYSSLQLKSFHFFDSNAVGDIVSRATMDMQAVEAFAKVWIGTVANVISTATIAFAIMFSINPTLSLVAVAPMPLTFYLTVLLWVKTMPLFRKMMLILGKLGAYIQQNIVGMKVARIFRREKEMEDGFKHVEEIFVDTAITA